MAVIGPNVLITSASAKVLLVQAFRDALGSSGKVFTADILSECAAAEFSDGHFGLGSIENPETLDQIRSICNTYKIGLLVPTRDNELPFYAEMRPILQNSGTFVHVSSPEIVRLCQDKRAFSKFLLERGLPTIPIIEKPDSNMAFPVFIRPVFGSGGHGARQIRSWEEYMILDNKEDFLLHPYINAPEYTIDLLMDLNGTQALDVVCRERVHIVAGESKISRIVDLPELSNLVKHIGVILGLIGHNTVQAFVDPFRGPLIIEVNPRFGGASNLSIRAGLDSPRRIIQLLKGDNDARIPRRIVLGAKMLRYSQDVILGLG